MQDFKRAMQERDRRRQNRRDLIEAIGVVAFFAVVYWLLPKLLNGELL